MPNNRAHLSICVDAELHDKLQYVAKYEGRSMSKQVLHLVTATVREFEEKHGPITEQDIADARRF